jgi:hypothetical protein
VLAGSGIAASLIAGAWVLASLDGRPSAGSADSHAVVAKAAVGAGDAKLPVRAPTQAATQLAPTQAVLIKAKLTTLITPSPARREEASPAPPAPPVLAGVDLPPPPAPATPQPMEVAMQTAAAPARPPADAAPTPLAKPSYFGHGAPSLQRLPIPSR